MKITILGSGNVGTHLAKALYAAGYQILQIWSREYDHAENLANQVFAEPIDRLKLLYPTADIYILAVADDALFDLALDLKLRDAIVLHTAGSVSLKVLSPISRKHGVIWSPQTFIRDVAMDYSTLPFCIEGSSPEVTKQIQQLLLPVSQHIYNIDTQQRQWLHLAAVMTNNFGNAINALAQDLLLKHNIPFEILHPIIEMTAEKLKHGNLWQQQTGPARRQDQKTIDRHRSMLVDDDKLMKLYELLTEIIQENTLRKKDS
ncbi:MAG: DUF2520 domain-containing protein [Bacteroidales bacterium]|nr:DUF2520 domain-containing protein [Bacteroidales bacterium]MCR5064336.1 DUF2520 domain-containing protein [Bacteroidales bacterium]